MSIHILAQHKSLNFLSLSLSLTYTHTHTHAPTVRTCICQAQSALSGRPSNCSNCGTVTKLCVLYGSMAGSIFIMKPSHSSVSQIERVISRIIMMMIVCFFESFVCMNMRASDVLCLVPLTTTVRDVMPHTLMFRKRCRKRRRRLPG